MTELETTQAARILALESSLRSLAQIARVAVAEQARFLADGLIVGVERVLTQAALPREPCYGDPCRWNAQCPACRAARIASVVPPNVDRNPDVAGLAGPVPVGDCPKPPLPGGWPCALHRDHPGECAEIPF